jgi:hypothetical protein
MATLPVMGYVVGGALSTGLVARTQRAGGGRCRSRSGWPVALASALLCAWAAFTASFWLLCTATLVAGYYSANGQLYRFAAAELAPPITARKPFRWCWPAACWAPWPAPTWPAPRARCWPCRLRGLCGAGAVALLSMACMAAIRFEAPPPRSTRPASPPVPASWPELMRQPAFLVAVLGAALGYGVMNLLMAATPLAMQVCGFAFDDAALVLEWHVIGMFAPGFFTGHLIKRFGVLPVMGAGVLLNLACVAVALMGVDLHHFGIALFLLGVGWNFLFTGSTTLAHDRPTAPKKRTARRRPSTSACLPPWR